MAVTVMQGTNQYWAWGEDDSGQVGNGTNVDNVETPAGPLPFVHFNTCGDCVQLGTNGSFTATATGTLFLFLNDDNFSDNSGSYTAMVSGVSATNVIVMANNRTGVEIGTVTNGNVYTYTASGICHHCSDLPDQCPSDANGTGPRTGLLWDCTDDRSGFVCPDLQCVSLVGKIE